MTATIGTRVMRKRDKATGTIVGREQMRHRFGTTTIVHVRLDDHALAVAAGGDMIGDLGWLRSYFAIGGTR